MSLGTIGALGASLGQLFNFFQAQDANKRAEERFEEFKGPAQEAIGDFRGLLDSGPSNEEIEAIARGLTPGQTGLNTFRGANPGFNMKGFMEGLGGATQAGLNTLGVTSGQIANLFGRTEGAVGTALGEARGLLSGGRVDDTLGLGQRIIELSGLNELQANPQLEAEQAGLAGRRQQALVNQALGASADEGQRAALLGDIGTQANIRALAGEERAQAFNKALADTRAGTLTSTGSLMEQLNAQLLSQEAGTFGQEANLLASMGGQQAGLQAGLGQSAANAQLATIAPLLQAFSTDASLGMQGAQIEAGLASQAEMDPMTQIAFQMNKRNQDAQILQAIINSNIALSGATPPEMMLPISNIFDPLSQRASNRQAQSDARVDTGFF